MTAYCKRNGYWYECKSPQCHYDHVAYAASQRNVRRKREFPWRLMLRGLQIGLLVSIGLAMLDNFKNWGDTVVNENDTPIKQLAGGWSMDRIAYSPVSVAHAYEIIKQVRPTLELPTTDAMAGHRFNSDDAVFLRLESMYAEGEFMRCPRASVEGALIECAQSDWWYTYEKSYEDDLEPEPIDEDE